jgi:type VI secretion system ImpM family protein
MSASSGRGPPADCPEPWPGPAGWFGKIPALGDFVSRRLPPEFIEPWDQWLSEELFGAQQALGANWLQSYLNAPIWRFALTPGALDAQHWLGVLMPSVDRIGRQFPLTFAASFAPHPDSLDRWWSTLLAVAMRAKEPDCDADALESALLASPGQVDREPSAEPFQSQVVPALTVAATGTSLWWSWCRDDPGGETVWVLDGLPRHDRFLQLICPGFAASGA